MQPRRNTGWIFRDDKKIIENNSKHFMQWIWLTQIVVLGCGFILFGNIMTPLEWRCFLLLQGSNDFPWRGFKAFEVNLIAEDKHEITHILMTWWQLTSWSYIWSSRTSLAAFLGWFICTCWSRLSTGLGKERWCSIGFPGFIFLQMLMVFWCFFEGQALMESFNPAEVS